MTSHRTLAALLPAAALAALAALAGRAAAQNAPEPPNAPLALDVNGDSIALRYAGRVLATGRVGPDSARPELRVLVDTAGGRVTQVVKWTARGGGPLALTLTLKASGEAFPCEVEPRPEARRIVRNAVGLVRNLLNRGVYDRQADWVLAADHPARAFVTPAAASGDSTVFRLELAGREIALRFRPRFYQLHRGLAEYRPWTYRVWPHSVAGWSSWFAFFDAVTEADIVRTADVMRSTLAPWGYEYLQIDDGYEGDPIGLPANWLHPNAKFPSGLDSLRAAIAARALAPGIWTNVTFHDAPWARAHPEYFLPAPGGGPAYGNWVGFVLDGANPATMRELVLPVYDTLARQGWRYFKVDALRHLRYEGYDSYPAAFASRGLDRSAVYRSFVQQIRDAIGRSAFMLGCWGIRPELVGIVDGVRVGTDGFGYGGFAQYNSFNNVVWRNDPDHVQVAAPDAFRATTITSLTGSLLMLTDKPEVYRTARVEAARRAAPVPFTLPGQLYDVDPSRSSRIGEAGVSVSGSGPRPFDADQRLDVALYQLDVARPFEQWTVLARTGLASRDSVRFADLGLAADRPYVVFEFWTRRLVGAFTRGFVPGPVDPRYEVQDFCIRERQDRPQLLATSRHVSCGAVDLAALSWSGDTLSGSSDVVGGDDYDLFVSEPAGYRFAGAAAEGARVVSALRAGSVRVVRLRAERGGRVGWRVAWRH